MRYDFTIEPFHVPGRHNEFADAVSRLHNLGDAMRLRSYLENNAIAQCHLLYHMSVSTFLYISQSWNGRWMKTLHISGRAFSQKTRRGPTGPSFGHI